MPASLRFTAHALKDLELLDKKVAARIIDKLDWFVIQPDPFFYAKKLAHSDFGTYRFRVGDYRILFDIEEKTGNLVILLVLRVKHRKEVYGL